MIFDKMICLNNIRYLAKAKGINLGDLETGAGVSAGYLSRIGKEDNKSSPSIEVLTSIADKLGVSLDGLVGFDYAGLTPTERYIIDFIEKLITETMGGTQSWEKESLAVFANIDRYRDDTTSHPLFAVVDDRITYNSYFATKAGTSPAGEFYHTPLTASNQLYITKVSYPDVAGFDYEIYITEHIEYSHSWNIEPVCATNPGTETAFNSALERLYTTVRDACRNVKVNQNVRNIIDRFMNPINIDDGELPF